MEALPLAAALLGGVDVSAAVILNFTGNFERNVVNYQCEGLDPVSVQYINADPNYLAVMSVGDRKMVFVSVIAASGAKYVAGEYEWWTKGSEATFTNLRSEPQAPVACLEVTETP